MVTFSRNEGAENNCLDIVGNRTLYYFTFLCISVVKHNVSADWTTEAQEQSIEVGGIYSVNPAVLCLCPVPAFSSL